jgi:PAS domain S-box-containing protein
MIGTNIDITDRKRAEEVLHRSEEKYRGLFDESIAAVYVFDEKKNFIDSNQAGLDLLGYSRDELLSMSIPDVDADPVVVLPAHKQLLSGKNIINYEHQLRRKDGTIITAINNSRPLTDTEGNVIGMQSTIIDLTERRQAEDKLRYQSTLTENISDAVVSHDLDFKIISWNEAAQEIFGWKAEEVIGRSMEEVFHTEKADIKREEMLASIDDKGFWRDEVIQTRKDGERIHVHSTVSKVTNDEGNAVGFVGVARDITKHKQAEEKLKESEAKYRDLVDNPFVGVFTTTLDGRFLFVNDAMTRIYAFDSSEQMLAEGSLARWSDPKRREQMLAELREQGSVTNFEAEIITNTGKHIHVLFSAKLQADDISGMVMDITELKESEKLSKDSEARFRMISEHAPVMMDAFDRDGRCILWNQECEKVFGWTREEIFAHENPLVLFYPDPEIRKQVIHSVTTKPDKVFREWHPRRKDGLELTCLWANFELPDGNIISLGYDITERQQTENALQTSETNLIKAQEVAHIGSWSLDLRENNLVWTDENYRIFGIPAGTPLTYEKFLEVVHPEDREYVDEKWKAAIEGEPYDIEHRLLVDNKVKWVREKAEMSLDDTGNPKSGIGITQDITERKRAEDKIRESEEKYRTLVEQAQDGVAVLQDGIIKFVNPQLADMQGYSAEELIGDTFQKHIAPDQLPKTEDIYRRRINNEDVPSIYESALQRKDGSRLEVEFNAGLTHYNGKTADLVIVRDITDRKRAERKINESEQKLSGILGSITDHMSMMDKDLNIVWANDVAKQLFGEDIIGGKCYTCYHKRGHVCGGCLVKKTFDDGLVHNHITKVINADGDEMVFWRTSSVAAYDDDNNPELVIEFSRDITEQKKVEEELRAYQKRLKGLASQLTIAEELERRRIAEDLHDQIGQSLALARLQIAAALKSTTDSKLTSILNELSESMLQATQDTRHLILDLSYPTMNELGLGPAISDWLEEQVGQRYGLETEVIHDGHKLPLDDEMRAILFRNIRELLTNVVKHAQAKKVSVSLEEINGDIKVVVEDDGVGFDPIAASGDLRRMDGFGLFSIEERMADLGGSLEVVSAPGKGSRIILILPSFNPDIK